MLAGWRHADAVQFVLFLPGAVAHKQRGAAVTSQEFTATPFE